MTNTVNDHVNVDYMSVKEAADYLGVSTQRIYRMEKAEDLDSFRPWPRRVMLTRTSVEAWKRGERKVHESVQGAKDYIGSQTTGPIGRLSVQVLSNMVYEYITTIRPDWHRSEAGRWANATTQAIIRTADVPR